MLVLSRKNDEQIVIDAFDAEGSPVQVWVTVVEIRGDKVRIGVDAPKSVPVNRSEVAIAKQRDPSNAAKTTVSVVRQAEPACKTA